MADNDFGAFADLVPKGALGPSGGLTGEKVAEIKGKLAAGRTLRQHLDHVQRLYDTTLKGVGPRKSIEELIPSQRNSRFDAAAKQVTLLGRQAFRVPGSGSDTEGELKVLLDALQPNRWSFDSANEERISGARSMLDAMERNYAPMVGEQPQLPARARDAGLDDLIAEYQRRKGR